MEKTMDDGGLVLCSVHAMQYGSSEYEHCYPTDGQAVRLGLSDDWPRAVVLLLVQSHLLSLLFRQSKSLPNVARGP